jgi:hypothetical protein
MKIISSNKKPDYISVITKIIDTIDSCENEIHLKLTKRLIDLYIQMFNPSDEDVNECLSYLFDKYDELGIELIDIDSVKFNIE